MNSDVFEGLSTTLAGVRMRSPIGVGSIGLPMVNPKRLTPERHAEVLLQHVAAGAGFINLPGTGHIPDAVLEELKKRARPTQATTSFPGWKGWRFMRAETDGSGSDSLYMASSPAIAPETWANRFRDHGIAAMVQVMKQRRPKDVPIIANVVGIGIYPEGYVTTAKACEEAGVDLIEVNFSGANPAGREEAVRRYLERDFDLWLGGGAVIAVQYPDIVENIVKEVARAVSIPVGVKISPETGFPGIVDMARRVKNAGARFINCGNQAVAIAPPDIYNRGRPKWAFMDGNPIVSIQGNWLWPIVFKQVASVAKFAPGLDIAATGGLSRPERIVEAMMLGARTTEVATAMLFTGRSYIRKTIGFLSRFVKEQGYRSVEDFIGLGQQYIRASEQVNFRSDRVIAEVDTVKCSGCGRCTDHICLAMVMDNRVARVTIEDCLGCGMCVALCRDGAVALRERP